ncbi:MAG: Ppx/GppA phosphatase family protein [Syntrophomonas sp.]|nr:Ppx/GppA phosphatase family protein [Syntrophomonas sp.]
MRLAAIDIGTNSCRLLIADTDTKNSFITLCKELDTTRIGEGTIKSGFISNEAMSRTLNTLRQYQQKMQEYKVEKYQAIATSAVREADNKDEFVHRVWEDSNLRVKIVNGEEEARLSYLGVKKGLKMEPEPVVADIGGGSTEFIYPPEDLLISFPIGAVRATEADMLALQIAKVITSLARFKNQLQEHPLVLVGGTASTLAAMKLGMDEYNAELVHGTALTRSEVGDLYNLLERMPLSLRRRLPGLQPERADIINKGVLIVLVIMELMDRNEVTISETELLHGIIWSLIG